MIGYPYSESDFRQASLAIRPYADLTWFGIDSVNCLAVFISAGFGPIPIKALADPVVHKHIYTDIFQCGPSENRDIIELSKELGCYVFDWLGHGGELAATVPYTKIYSPSSCYSIDRKTFVGNGILVSFDGRFSNMDSVLIRDLNLPLNVKV